MKKFKILFIIMFFLILLLPILYLNTEPGAVSKLDNAYYPDRPSWTEAGSVQTYIKEWKDYIEKRLGYRDEMITGYQFLHDRLWGELIHPSYIYGRDGYIFGGGSRYSYNQRLPYTEFHEDFARALLQMKNYCEARGIYFVFMFEPAKARVLSDYLPAGGAYRLDYAEELISKLTEYGVPFVDNYDILRDKFLAGEQVYNRKYDANHWNFLGAYYGVNNLLQNIKTVHADQHINDKSEFRISEKRVNSLPVSQFYIEEDVPVWEPLTEFEDRTEWYAEALHLDEQHRYFISLHNPVRAAEGARRALFFQGSYMNNGRHILTANAFADYTAVHDYQNALDFSYYLDIFQPDIVVFEQADYSLTDSYYDAEKLHRFRLPADYDPAVQKLPVRTATKQPKADLVETSKLATVKLTEIPEDIHQLYLVINDDVHLNFTTDNQDYALCGINLDEVSEKELLQSTIIGVGDNYLYQWTMQDLLIP